MKGEFTTTKIKRVIHKKVKEYCVKKEMQIPDFYEKAAIVFLNMTRDPLTFSNPTNGNAKSKKC